MQDYSVLYSDAIRLVICDDWHFTQNTFMIASFHMKLVKPPPFYQAWKVSCHAFLSISSPTIFLFNFGTVPKVWYFFVFHIVTTSLDKFWKRQLHYLKYIKRCLLSSSRTQNISKLWLVLCNAINKRTCTDDL